MIPGWMTDRGFSEGDLVKFKSVPGEPGMVICHDGLRPVEDQEAAYTWREIEQDYPDGVHLFCNDLRKAPTMDFYTTLTDAIEQEIIPLLGDFADEFDVEALAREVFTVDPVSGMLTHTGEGITDEMMERHER